jgi:hypothetical protein
MNTNDPKHGNRSPAAPAASPRPAYEPPRLLRKRSVAAVTLDTLSTSGHVTPFDGGGPGGGGPGVVGNG